MVFAVAGSAAAAVLGLGCASSSLEPASVVSPQSEKHEEAPPWLVLRCASDAGTLSVTATSDKQLALELSVGEKRFEQILSARDRPRVGWYGLTNVEHRRFVYVYGGLSRPIWVPEQTDCYPMRGSERCLWSTTPAHASTLPIDGTSIEVALEDTGDDGYMLFYVSESRFGLGKSPLGERVPCELSGSGAHELAAGAPATTR